MCTGAEIAMLAMAAAGTATSVISADEQADARRRAAAQGAEAEAKIQDKANEATQDFVTETFDPTTRAANYEGEAAGREKALGDLLASQSDQGMGEVSSATTGNLSDTYARARAGATASTAQKARNQAKLLSRAGATGGLFGREAIKGADYASDMLGFGVDSRLNQSLTGARYGQAASAGDDMAMLGGLLAGAGQAYGGYYNSQYQSPAPVVNRDVRP
jgi:hypothetical protein